MEDKETAAEPADDSTDALMEEYDRKRRNRADDVIAAQAVICILLGAALFCAELFRPDIAGELLGRLRGLSADSSFVVPNPIDIIIGYIDKL
ncbi:MAG: hypothetical protein IKH78_03710 [Ruminococcus sp.]|nr:hypothetical protein [Ruminococcus sp.]